MVLLSIPDEQCTFRRHIRLEKSIAGMRMYGDELDLI